MKSTIRSGYLKSFDKDLKTLQKKKGNFKVISSGLTRKIIFPKYKQETLKRLYYGNSSKDKLPGVHMVSAVRRNIDSYLKKGGKVPKVKYNPKLVLYNYDQINKVVNAKQPQLIYAIDINACFFRTAYNLKFINKDLFDKAWTKRKEWKFGLLASIGSLNKQETIEEYKNGVLTKTNMNKEYRNKYSPFYWAVINEVAKVMMEIANTLNDKFYMWLTDCVYIDREHANKVEKILNKYNYQYKTFYIEFESIDERVIKWHDFKEGGTKYINYNMFLNYTKDYTPFIKTY